MPRFGLIAHQFEGMLAARQLGFRLYRLSAKCRKKAFQSVQAITALPTNYGRQATFDLSKNRKAVVGAIATGMVLLIAVGWLLVQFANILRPTALDGLRFRDILTVTPGGGESIAIPFQLIVDAFVAFVLVMLTHESVHGMFYWWFAGKRPAIGIKGPFVYVSAPSGVYFPRNQYLVVGIAPLVVLTFVGLLLIPIVPAIVVPILILFIAFNAGGAGGDLLVFAWLLSYSPNTLMQDNGSSVVIYEPDEG